MSVHYKFKSSLEYDTVTFDGLHISVGDLKKSILQQKKIGKSADFDLQITNAQTKEIYEKDDDLIPKNTSVVISRIPVTNPTKKSWDRVDVGQTASQDSNSPSHYGFDKLSKTADLVNANATEDEKIKAMMSQSGQEYDPSKYVKSRSMTGPLPPNYTCYRCGKPGHWIKNCPTNNLEVKRSTGIPRSFMVPVDGPEHKGALLTSTGEFAVPLIDHQAYKEVKKEKPPFLIENQPEPEPETQLPDELLCMVCRDLLQDAVLIPCCGNSFCDECVRQSLLDSENHECPTCHEVNISPDTLIPNRFLRTAVLNFKNETGYTRVKRSLPIPSMHVPPTHAVEVEIAAGYDGTDLSPLQPDLNAIPAIEVEVETNELSQEPVSVSNDHDETSNGEVTIKLSESKKDIDSPPKHIPETTFQVEEDAPPPGDEENVLLAAAHVGGEEEDTRASTPLADEPIIEQDPNAVAIPPETDPYHDTSNQHYRGHYHYQRYGEHYRGYYRGGNYYSPYHYRAGARHEPPPPEENENTITTISTITTRGPPYMQSHAYQNPRGKPHYYGGPPPPGPPAPGHHRGAPPPNYHPSHPHPRRPSPGRNYHDSPSRHENYPPPPNRPYGGYERHPYYQQPRYPPHDGRPPTGPPPPHHHHPGQPPPRPSHPPLPPGHHPPPRHHSPGRPPYSSQPPPPGAPLHNHQGLPPPGQPPPPGVGPPPPPPTSMAGGPPPSGYPPDYHGPPQPPPPGHHGPPPYRGEDPYDPRRMKEKKYGDPLDEFARELMKQGRHRSRRRSHDRGHRRRRGSRSRSRSYRSSKSWSGSRSRSRSRSYSYTPSRSSFSASSGSKSRSRSRSYSRSRSRSRARHRSRSYSRSRSGSYHSGSRSPHRKYYRSHRRHYYRSRSNSPRQRKSVSPSASHPPPAPGQSLHGGRPPSAPYKRPPHAGAPEYSSYPTDPFASHPPGSYPPEHHPPHGPPPPPASEHYPEVERFGYYRDHHNEYNEPYRQGEHHRYNPNYRYDPGFDKFNDPNRIRRRGRGRGGYYPHPHYPRDHHHASWTPESLPQTPPIDRRSKERSPDPHEESKRSKSIEKGKDKSHHHRHKSKDRELKKELKAEAAARKAEKKAEKLKREGFDGSPSAGVNNGENANSTGEGKTETKESKKERKHRHKKMKDGESGSKKRKKKSGSDETSSQVTGSESEKPKKKKNKKKKEAKAQEASAALALSNILENPTDVTANKGSLNVLPQSQLDPLKLKELKNPIAGLVDDDSTKLSSWEQETTSLNWEDPHKKLLWDQEKASTWEQDKTPIWEPPKSSEWEGDKTPKWEGDKTPKWENMNMAKWDSLNVDPGNGDSESGGLTIPLTINAPKICDLDDLEIPISSGNKPIKPNLMENVEMEITITTIREETKIIDSEILDMKGTPMPHFENEETNQDSSLKIIMVNEEKPDNLMPLPELSKWERDDFEDLSVTVDNAELKTAANETKTGLSTDIIQKAEKAILQKALKAALTQNSLAFRPRVIQQRMVTTTDKGGKSEIEGSSQKTTSEIVENIDAKKTESEYKKDTPIFEKKLNETPVKEKSEASSSREKKESHSESLKPHVEVSKTSESSKSRENRDPPEESRTMTSRDRTRELTDHRRSRIVKLSSDRYSTRDRDREKERDRDKERERERDRDRDRDKHSTRSPGRERNSSTSKFNNRDSGRRNDKHSSSHDDKHSKGYNYSSSSHRHSKDAAHDESKFEPNYDGTSDSDDSEKKANKHGDKSKTTSSSASDKNKKNSSSAQDRSKSSNDKPKSSTQDSKKEESSSNRKRPRDSSSSSATAIVKSSKDGKKLKENEKSSNSSESSSDSSDSDGSDYDTSPKKKRRSESPSSDQKHKSKKGKHKKHKKHKHKHKKKKTSSSTNYKAKDHKEDTRIQSSVVRR